MNFMAQGLQRTWPQGIVSMALEALESVLLQAGHASVNELVDVFEFSPFWEKEMVTMVFRLRG